MSFPQTLTLKAFAKINLSLDITGILENGYHQLEMIMQSVSLHDKVTITTSDASQGISLSCSVPSLCPNEQNTAYKAANLFFKQCGIRPAVSIHIEKQIPSQAGLAGGSADAAAVLHGLNQLFQTNLTQKQLCEIGVQIGADVPFCISGNAALAQGMRRYYACHRNWRESLTASCPSALLYCHLQAFRFGQHTRSIPKSR